MHSIQTLSNSARFWTYSLHSRSPEIQAVTMEDFQQFVGLSPEEDLEPHFPDTAKGTVTCRIHPRPGSEPHLGTSAAWFVHLPRTDPSLRAWLPSAAHWIGVQTGMSVYSFVRRCILVCPSSLCGQICLGRQMGFRGSQWAQNLNQEVRKLG